jgi:hypothetical protein
VRILFVTVCYSIHTARWIGQLRDEQWDIHLFPADGHLHNLHPELRDITVHAFFRGEAGRAHASVRQTGIPWPFPVLRGRGLVHDLLDAMPGDSTSEAARLAKVIRRIQPDIVHSMELTGGVLTLAARERLDGHFPPWVHSSWGSDLFYFGNQPEYSRRVRRMMATCDCLMADCQRELDLAPGFGFTGTTLGVVPAAGGYRIEHMRGLRSEQPASARRLVMLKGRQDEMGGRALVALQALHACARELADYEIAIYTPQDAVAHAARYVSQLTGLRIRLIPRRSPHDEIVGLMGRARIAIGVGMTDGTPQAMLEAMVMGALPIQSNTADTRGWIEDGRNGLLVPPEDAEAIAAAVRTALLDDRLVDKASAINARLTSERIDIGIVTPRVVDIYRNIQERRQ